MRRKVEKSQEKQKELHDGKRILREFALKDPVYAENFTNRKPKWILGTIIKITGSLSYVIELLNATMRRHIDSIRRKESSNSEQDSETEMPGSELIRIPVGPTTALEDPAPQNQEPNPLPEPEQDPNPSLRRSTRSRQAPIRY